MTGVGGRPEIIIEGSNSLDGPWKVGQSFARMRIHLTHSTAGGMDAYAC